MSLPAGTAHDRCEYKKSPPAQTGGHDKTSITWRARKSHPTLHPPSLLPRVVQLNGYSQPVA
nr:MAG TPA: hypothetical protein [Caudoviricetes sp.]